MEPGQVLGDSLIELCWHYCISATQNLCQPSSHWDVHCSSSSSLFVPLDWERQVSCQKCSTIPHFYTKICESPAISTEGIEIKESELQPNALANCRCLYRESHSVSLKHFRTLCEFWVSCFISLLSSHLSPKHLSLIFFPFTVDNYAIFVVLTQGAKKTQLF